MSLVKNISGGPLDVPLLDRVVDDGETVEVPDFQADGESPLIWPENRWQPVDPPKVKPEKATGTTTISATGTSSKGT
jgi:hypothetical protein